MKKIIKTYAINTLFILSVIMIALKLAKIITWSWWIVLLPIWGWYSLSALYVIWLALHDTKRKFLKDGK